MCRSAAAVSCGGASDPFVPSAFAGCRSRCRVPRRTDVCRGRAGWGCSRLRGVGGGTLRSSLTCRLLHAASGRFFCRRRSARVSAWTEPRRNAAERRLHAQVFLLRCPADSRFGLRSEKRLGTAFAARSAPDRKEGGVPIRTRLRAAGREPASGAKKVRGCRFRRSPYPTGRTWEAVPRNRRRSPCRGRPAWPASY